MARLRRADGGFDQGQVVPNGGPVVGGDGEDGDRLLQKVLLGPDALVAGYEHLVAAGDGVADEVAVLQEMLSPVVGGVYLVVREGESQRMRDAVVEEYFQEMPPPRRSCWSIFEAWARTVLTWSSVT